MKAQVAYFSYGYQGVFTGLKGMNEVVKNYNTSRSWLDHQMKDFNYLDGFMLNFGGGFSNFWTDLEFDFRGQKRKASGTDLAGNYGSRYVKVKNNMFAFSMGVVGGQDNFAAAFGARMEIGNLKVKSKIDYSDNSKDTDWSQIGDDFLTARFGPELKLMFGSENGGMLSITTYCGWAMFRENLYTVDEDLNNTNYGFDEPAKFEIKNGVFGFAIGYGLFTTE
ncbi:MAG: hypothetical protein GC181_01210 [Bacteroidetes bacterium]|nr:hypothetical protein [Bacteroidota bacterium]